VGASAHLAVGSLLPGPGAPRCAPIALGRGPAAEAAAEAAEEVAVLGAGCDLWWRETTADVIPPIPELTLPLGRTKEGYRLGLCRTYGDSAEGRKIVGTLVLEGPDFGTCLFTRDDGTPSSLNGGGFHLLQARAAEALCEDSAPLARDLAQGLERRMDEFLTLADRETIARVSGTPFAELRSSVLSLGSCMLKQVLSPSRFVPHALNEKGLQLLRALLAERMGDARVRARGLHQHADFEAWQRDGFVIKDFDEVGDAGLHKLLQMASGEHEVGIPLPPYKWTSRNVTVLAERDPQNDMHIDTFASIVKVWIFDASVTPQHGPFEYVPGSHRESEPRLRWMHHYAMPPAREALVEPSFRLLGSPSAASAAADFVEHCSASSRPVLPLPGARRTLVIADTSGLHRRSAGVVGLVRRSWRLAGDNDGGLRRLDPYRWPDAAGRSSEL